MTESAADKQTPRTPKQNPAQMKTDHTYENDVVCPIVHDFITMWPPIIGEPNYYRHIRNRKSANARAQTKKARAKG